MQTKKGLRVGRVFLLILRGVSLSSAEMKRSLINELEVIFVKKASRFLALALAGLMVAALAACGAPKEEKTYVIYSDNAFPPFEYLDAATGKHVGLDMDILAAIAEDQGFAYEMNNAGFDPAMGAVDSGQADGMIAGMTITEERQQKYDFSDGYFVDGQIMAVAADSTIATLEDLRGQNVAAKIGTMSTQYVESIKDEYDLTISYFEDSPTMYAAVVQGNSAACFEDRAVVGWAIESNGIALKTVGDVIEPREYGFAVKKGQNAELIEMFNAGLQNLKDSGAYAELLAKYGY